MVQRNSIKKKSRLTKKKIVVLGAIIVATAFCVLAPLAATVLLMFGAAMLTVFFPILAFLPISAVLLSIFAGLGAIMVWAFRRRDLKRVLSPWSALVLIAFAAAILTALFPILTVFFTILLPVSAFLLSIFVGLGAIIVCASFRRDLKRVLKLIKFTFGAIVLSSFLWVALCGLPRILTFLVAGLVVAYLYWPGKKRGLFLGVLEPVLALELALLLTINLMIF